MENSKQTLSELLLSVDQTTPFSPNRSPPSTPPASFTYLSESLSIPSNIILKSQKDPYSFSPPKSITTSAPVKTETFDEFFKPTPNDKPKQSFSNELRQSIRLSTKPSKVSYIDLEHESDSCIQTQHPAKRLKTSPLACLPYDRKVAKKEKLLEDIISKPVNTKEKMILNPYLTNPAPGILSRPLCESKSFDFEDMKSKKIVIDDVMTSIGWKEFCELDEVIYPNLVQQFYSSAEVLEGHDVIICFMNQTQIIVTTDILAKVLNIPNSGVKLFGRKWYDKVISDRNTVLNEFFGNVKPAKDFAVTSLKNEYKILHNICTHCLLPRISNRYRVNDNDLMILYHLTRGKMINLPYLIIRHMIAAIKDTKGNGGLPYSMALTKIFHEFKLSFIGETAAENLKPFNRRNIAHIKLHDGIETLGLHQIPLPQEEFLKEEEEENPLLSLVNAVIVESHLSSQSAPLDVPNTYHHFVDPNISTDLKLSLDGNVEPNPTTPLFDCENSALFGSSCLNRFINSPKNDTPLLSDLPIPSHFSSFDSFKSTETSPKRDTPIEPTNSIISNEMILAEVASLRGNVNNLRECFVSFMFQYFGMSAPVPVHDPGSSSNPPPNQQ
jgi:hypothetical protein